LRHETVPQPPGAQHTGSLLFAPPPRPGGAVKQKKKTRAQKPLQGEASASSPPILASRVLTSGSAGPAPRATRRTRRAAGTAPSPPPPPSRPFRNPRRSSARPSLPRGRRQRRRPMLPVLPAGAGRSKNAEPPLRGQHHRRRWRKRVVFVRRCEGRPRGFCRG